MCYAFATASQEFFSVIRVGMPFIGNTGKIDQIYLARLDPQQVEDQQAQNLDNIRTGDIEASNVLTSNIGINVLEPSHNFELGSNLFMDDTLEADGFVLDVKKRARTEKLFVATQFGVSNANPTHAVDVSNVFFIETTQGSTNQVVIDGNVRSTNALITDRAVFGASETVVIDPTAPDEVLVQGNVNCQKLTATDGLSFGANILFDDVGSNVLVLTGNANQVGDFVITGNLTCLNFNSTGTATIINPVNIATSNAIIELAIGGTENQDAAVVFHQANESNTFIGYVHQTASDATPGAAGNPGIDEFAIGRCTNGAASTTMDIVDDITGEEINVHVYGKLYTSNSVGVANTHPTETLHVGSNLWVSDEGSNVLVVSGNALVDGRFTANASVLVGSNVVIDDVATSVVQVTGNTSSTILLATDRIGIANATPLDSISVSDKFRVSETGANVMTVEGNAVVQSNLIAMSNLAVGRQTANETAHIQGSVRIGDSEGLDDDAEYGIKSTGQLSIHANDAGSGDDFASLHLKSGASAAREAAIDVRGGASNTCIAFSTLNSERMRLTSSGNLGLASTSPSERLTVDGNIQVVGSSGAIFGESFVSSNKSMKIRTDTIAGESFIESRVSQGKGLNLSATSDANFGDPAVTILDSGNVGLSQQTPEAKLHVGGSTFINDALASSRTDGVFDHSNTPLTVTNLVDNASVNSPNHVLNLCRRGPASSTIRGQKAEFTLSRWESSGNNSRTRLDINLAHDAYNNVSVMTMRSDSRVGIGTNSPRSTLQVKATGTSNPEGNGLLVFNPTKNVDTEDAIACIQVHETGGNPFASFSVFDDDVIPATRTGWSIGLDNATSKDFRITANVSAVSNVQQTAVYINGATSNVGIGTDNTTYGKLSVDGDIIMGNRLEFGGVPGDQRSRDGGTGDFGHTFLEEKRKGSSNTSELLIFKGNDKTDRDLIRHVAAQHKFFVYRKNTGLVKSEVDSIRAGLADITNVYEHDQPVMMLSAGAGAGGRVNIGGVSDTGEAAARDDTRLYISGDVELTQSSKLMVGNEVLQFSSASGTSTNAITCAAGYNLQFLNGFVERMRIASDGRVGVGTQTVDNDFHVFNASTGSVTVAKFESAKGASGTTTTGANFSVRDGATQYGGYVRGFKTHNGPTGLVLGSHDAGVDSDSIFFSGGKCGVGTADCEDELHLYDSNAMIESSTSNAFLNFKTSYGSATSNVRAGTNGNLYLTPANSDVIVMGNLDVQNDISFGGTLELGTTLGINLGAGVSPETALHVGGGVITNDGDFACKRYSKSFTVGAGAAKDIQLVFGPRSMLAEIKAVLREIGSQSNENSINTLIIELQGGNSNTATNTTSTIPLAFGRVNVFGGANDYPWNIQACSTTTTSLTLVPKDVSNARVYAYDIFVKLYSSIDGKLESIKRDSQNITVQNFTY